MMYEKKEKNIQWTSSVAARPTTMTTVITELLVEIPISGGLWIAWRHQKRKKNETKAFAAGGHEPKNLSTF